MDLTSWSLPASLSWLIIIRDVKRQSATPMFHFCVTVHLGCNLEADSSIVQLMCSQPTCFTTIDSPKPFFDSWLHFTELLLKAGSNMAPCQRNQSVAAVFKKKLVKSWVFAQQSYNISAENCRIACLCLLLLALNVPELVCFHTFGTNVQPHLRSWPINLWKSRPTQISLVSCTATVFIPLWVRLI